MPCRKPVNCLQRSLVFPQDGTHPMSASWSACDTNERVCTPHPLNERARDRQLQVQQTTLDPLCQSPFVIFYHPQFVKKLDTASGEGKEDRLGPHRHC